MTGQPADASAADGASRASDASAGASADDSLGESSAASELATRAPLASDASPGVASSAASRPLPGDPQPAARTNNIGTSWPSTLEVLPRTLTGYHRAMRAWLSDGGAEVELSPGEVGTRSTPSKRITRAPRQCCRQSRS